MNKLVSVIIPVFNSEKTILRALKSVLSQTYRPLEIIIIDDCSSDSTYFQILNFDFQDIKLGYKINKNNMGPGFSRNIGIEMCTWHYVAFLDADDEWLLNNKIEIQVDFLKNNYSYEFVSTKIQSNNPNIEFSFTSDADFRKRILCSYLAQTSTWLMTRRLIQECGLFSQGRSEDYEYLLKIWKITKCFCLPIHSTFYYFSPHSDYNSGRISSYFRGLLLCFLYRKTYWNFYTSFLNRILRPIKIFFY